MIPIGINIILRVWRSQPGKFFFISTKDRSGKWTDHPFRRSKIGDIAGFVEQHMDKDVYFCPHGFSKPRRLKQRAEIPHLLWADLDAIDPRDLATLTPTIAWESSPKRFAAIWVIDELMTEDLNRRLTYHLKCDRGGWDITQVLRMPGTKNYKYESKPTVRLLWSDGPEYAVRDLAKNLPKGISASVGVGGERRIALGLYRKYEAKLPGWFRRTIWSTKSVTTGRRSELLWKMNCTLNEIGATGDEIFEIMRVSPWNKFVKRRDGDEQLRREIDKAVTQHMRVIDDENPREELERDTDGELEEDDEEASYQFLTKPMSEVEEEKLDWLWYPYLARGEVTILEGDPGLGKSYLAQMVSAAICDGTPLPSVKARTTPKGKVAYFDMENSPGSVTKKRLVGNGCTELGSFYQEAEPFSVDDEDTLDQVYVAIERLRPALVVFDTLNTYIGTADTHNSAETQQAFKRFIDIARRFGCSVLVLRHLTKTSKGTSALYRGQGSIAFVGLARVVLTVGTHPEQPETRVMAVTKLNVARTPKSLSFQIIEVPGTLKDDDRSKFVWGEFVDYTADEILAPREPRGDDEEAKERTVDWLRELLTDETLEVDRVSAMAEARGIGAEELENTAAQIGARRVKMRGGRMGWTIKTGEAAS